MEARKTPFVIHDYMHNKISETKIISITPNSFAQEQTLVVCVICLKNASLEAFVQPPEGLGPFCCVERLPTCVGRPAGLQFGSRLLPIGRHLLGPDDSAASVRPNDSEHHLGPLRPG